MNTVAIIQARMSSSRLPGKVLKELVGETVLGRVVHRLRRSRKVSEIVVATTRESADQAIVVECARLEVASFRGSEQDVLDRYYHAARAHAANVVVRITSDCPVIDPALVDQTIAVFEAEHADYASNISTRSYPRGLDTEVFTVAALDRAWSEAREPHQREHVTPYFYEHGESFKLASLGNPEDYSHYRWTLDTCEDLELLREIYSRFDGMDHFSWLDVLHLMAREPELAEINSGVLQKSVREH